MKNSDSASQKQHNATKSHQEASDVYYLQKELREACDTKQEAERQLPLSVEALAKACNAVAIAPESGAAAAMKHQADMHANKTAKRCSCLSENDHVCTLLCCDCILSRLKDQHLASKYRPGCTSNQFYRTLKRVNWCSTALEEASSAVAAILQKHNLNECPKLQEDCLGLSYDTKELLLQKGIQPASDQGDRRLLVHRLLASNELSLADPKMVGKVESICLVVHCLLQGQSMRSYEQLHAFMVSMGRMPEGTRAATDDAAWRIARIAHDVVHEEILKRMSESKYLAFSIDDSADIVKKEQC